MADGIESDQLSMADDLLGHAADLLAASTGPRISPAARTRARNLQKSR
ncbi:hypothetical protein [Streptomyces atratus]|nr:hypothetical protein [Streptomyces atratus]